MSFSDTAGAFIQHYGYLALFVLMALETAMILHFVPSEFIVTVAARSLANDTVGLAAVVAVSTAGATTGSLMLYGASRYGGRPFLLRHPRLFHLDAPRLDRMQSLFQRPLGESMVFLFRLLPFLRAFVSIPAGLARMDLWKFTLLSAGGALLFNFVFAWSGYRSNDPDSLVSRALRAAGALVESHWLTLLVWAAILLALAVGAWLAWRHRAHITQRHGAMIARTWERVALAIIGLGLLLAIGALVAPTQERIVAGWIQRDVLADTGLDQAAPWVVALVLALEVLALGAFVLALGRALRRLVGLWMARRDASPPNEGQSGQNRK